MLQTDEEAQFLVLKAIPFIVLGVLLIAGAWSFSTGCTGTGLVLLGVFSLAAGIGGSLRVGFGLLKVAGPAGFVLIVVGAVLATLYTGC